MPALFDFGASLKVPSPDRSALPGHPKSVGSLTSFLTIVKPSPEFYQGEAEIILSDPQNHHLYFMSYGWMSPSNFGKLSVGWVH